MLLVRPTYASFASLGVFVVVVAAAFEPFTQQAVVYPSRDLVVRPTLLPRSSHYNIPYSASSRYLAAVKIAMYKNVIELGTPVPSTLLSRPTAQLPTALGMNTPPLGFVTVRGHHKSLDHRLPRQHRRRESLPRPRHCLQLSLRCHNSK